MPKAPKRDTSCKKGKLDFRHGGCWANFPPGYEETREAAYRRGYKDGYHEALHDFGSKKLTTKLWHLVDWFVCGQLVAWVGRGHRPLVKDKEGKLHYDCHKEVECEIPPRLDWKELKKSREGTDKAKQEVPK